MPAELKADTLAARAREVLEIYPTTSADELYEQLLTSYPGYQQANQKHVRQACRRAVRGESGWRPRKAQEVEVELDAADTTPWKVENGHYTWATGNGHTLRLSVELVDELFYNFSQHGLNLTQTQVINKFNLEVWQWNSLKARLGLAKLSNVFSPYTVEQTPKEELAYMIERKMNARFENRGLIIEQAYQKTAIQQYHKVIAESEDTAYLNQKVLAELADRFPEARVRYLLRGPVGPSAPRVLTFTLADTHAGAKVKDMIRSFCTDREQLFDYADQLIAEVNAVGAAEVYLLGLGDYLETITGLNHPNSFKSADAFGADAIALAYEFLVYFIDRVVNLRGILAVGGNHCRLTSSNKEDTASGAATAIFYFLRLNYGKLLDIEYHPKLVYREIDGMLYILKHGYTGDVSNEKKANDLIADFQTRGVFTLLLTADKHTRGTFLDGTRKRWVRCPSLFTGNEYSEDLGFSSLAGGLLIHAVKGYPRIIDVPLLPLEKNVHPVTRLRAA